MCAGICSHLTPGPSASTRSKICDHRSMWATCQPMYRAAGGGGVQRCRGPASPHDGEAIKETTSTQKHQNQGQVGATAKADSILVTAQQIVRVMAHMGTTSDRWHPRFTNRMKASPRSWMLCPHAEFWGPAYQQRFNVLTYGHIADTRGRHAHTHKYRPGIDPAVFLTVYPELLGGSCSH